MSLKEEAVYLKVENIRSDIKQIEHYAGEEYSLFAKLSAKLKNIKSYYNSPNSGSFSKIGDSLLKERDGIKLKRTKYKKLYLDASDLSLNNEL